MATRTTRRTTTGATRSRSRKTKSKSATPSFSVPPHVARSLIGLFFLVLGAITLIALVFPDAGLLNRYVDEILRPAFGQGAWLLAVLLIVAGIVIERPPAAGYGSTLTLVGGLLVFVAGLGMIHLLAGQGSNESALRSGGGVLGHLLESALTALVSSIGAFVVLLGLIVAGLLLMFNTSLRTLLSPATAGGRKLAGVVASASTSGRRDAAVAVQPELPSAQRGERPKRERPVKVTPEPPELPVPETMSAPLSQTIWTGRGDGA
jgi:S-DNA-T family DNA segregation ATPase FtsK/SpoIIIE